SAMGVIMAPDPYRADRPASRARALPPKQALAWLLLEAGAAPSLGEGDGGSIRSRQISGDLRSILRELALVLIKSRRISGLDGTKQGQSDSFSAVSLAQFLAQKIWKPHLTEQNQLFSL